MKRQGQVLHLLRVEASPTPRGAATVHAALVRRARSAHVDHAHTVCLRRSDRAGVAGESRCGDERVEVDGGRSDRERHGGQSTAVRFEFNAPDRMRYTIENGPTSVQIGSNDYQQKPDGSWFANRRGVPFAWPQFAYATVAEQRARKRQRRVERSSLYVEWL